MDSKKIAIVFSVAMLFAGTFVLAAEKEWISGNYKYTRTAKGIQVTQVKKSAPAENPATPEVAPTTPITQPETPVVIPDVAPQTPESVPDIQQTTTPTTNDIIQSLPEETPAVPETPTDVLQSATSSLLTVTNNIFKFFLSPFKALHIIK